MIESYRQNKAAYSFLKISVAFLDHSTRIFLMLSMLSLCMLLLAYVYEVGARYFFNMPTSWSYDFSTWCLAVSIMAALPDVTRRKANISIDFLLQNLPPQAEEKIRRMIFVVSSFFCLAAAGICFGETFRQFDQNIETNWIIPVPKWWISIVLPFGLALCGLQFLRSAAMDLINKADRV